MKPLILFVIGVVFGTAGGFIAGAMSGERAGGHDHAAGAHDHGEIVAWDGALPVPDLTLALTPDSVSGQNLRIAADGFTYTPDTVGGADSPGGGHAHVYLNGVKVGRVYGPWLHLPEAETGDTIRVSLHANSHAHWGVDGQPIAAEITVP